MLLCKCKIFSIKFRGFQVFVSLTIIGKNGRDKLFLNRKRLESESVSGRNFRVTV